ncbi:Lrp/AsnC family transcriptional regulator [Rhodococcus sp. BP-332]|uniref:Lrp/AsnC family transcriptional regulator n=1 Tax=Rhodococcus sp. BP-332 TaxID=2739447 RepID=UPI001C9A2D5D|nr:Lrp/AsnC family transcriptional regulator [Rhodococcus sp. BP-332]MBY6677157.1 Lrp/AsnC family transcriptional regulator [Rhodococcus sp. BP-332]
MPRNPHPEVDEIDRRLLDELQSDGRATVAHLARVVNLSSSATADRVRRLTDIGVITGYSVTVDTGALGYTVSAFVRLAYPSGNYGPFDALVASTPEIIEAHHVTGDDCFIIKVLARSMRDLERVTGRLATLGSITTNVVYSSPLPSRRITPA